MAGYAVYGSTGNGAPFTRLQSGLVPTNTFTDVAGTSAVYMVRAVKLEVSPSGSYYNSSQGVFEDLQGDFGSPKLGIVSTNGIMKILWPSSAVGFQLESTALLSSPDWEPDPNLIQTANAINFVIEQFPSIPRFFRLVHD